MNISDAEKTVINGLTQKDESTIASTDLVQLYAQDGTPNGKISKADLMDAVKASLPALLSDQSTNGTDFLSLASGVLGKMSAGNLASVLGVLPYDMSTTTNGSINGYIFETGLYIFGMVKDDFSKGQVYISFHVQGQTPTEEGVALYTKGNCAVISNYGGTIAIGDYTEGEVYYGFRIKLA